MTVAHAIMFAGVPFWFAAAAARQSLILDPAAAFGAKLLLACLSFLVFWAFLSVLGASDPIRSGRAIVTLVSGIMIFFLIIGTVTSDRLHVYIAVLCLTLALTCLISVVGFYEPHLRSEIFKGTDRAFGFFKNPNQFGMTLSTLIPVAAAVFLGQRRRRLVWGVCLFSLLLGLILSGSKTNLLISSGTLVFVVCAYSLVAYSGPQRFVMMAVSLLITCAILVANFALLAVFNPRALRLFETFFTGEEELQSLASRNVLWRKSLDQFQNDPIFGQGAGQSIDYAGADQLVTHSHNVLLDYLRTLGAPGFLLLSVIILTVVCLSMHTIWMTVRAHRTDASDRILCIGLAMAPLAYIVANLSSDSMGPATSPFFWLVLYLGLTGRLLLRP